MNVVTDARGCATSGAHPNALRAYERAMAAFQGWRGGIGGHLEQALQHAPDFLMAHVMQAYLAVSSRDPRQVRSARPILARAAGLRANACEQMHLAAIGAVVDDDYEGAKARLGELLLRQPRDALALQYHAVLSMHAFGLGECGDYERAEAATREALALHPADARAHRAMAHVFEI